MHWRLAMTDTNHTHWSNIYSAQRALPGDLEDW